MPRRKVLCVLDALLLLSILYFALAPAPNDGFPVGPAASHSYRPPQVSHVAAPESMHWSKHEAKAGEDIEAAAARKFDTRNGGTELNAYDGLEGILYNKFLFRAG